MSKVFISYIITQLLLLNWDLGVHLVFLIPSGFQSLWIQPLISKVREIVFIIICNLEGLIGYQF